jgi:hypothetical protein
MAISLYDASVPNYLQTLDAVGGFLEKGLTYCKENNIDPEDIVESRIVADMLPFRYQIHSVVFHSQNAIEAIKTGLLTLTGQRPAHGYEELRTLVAEAATALRTVTPEEIDSREGAELVFQIGETRRVFTSENFLMSFSLPNFYFHAATAYDILRAKGAPIGKRDFMGALRLKV